MATAVLGCAAALAQCPGSGDCFVPNGTPGCDDPACCDTVCALDPFCCDVEWDDLCVDGAFAFCSVGGGPENDDCSSALAVGDETVSFSTSGANTDGPFDCATNQDIWYEYTAACDLEVTASLCGSSYDTHLSVYDGASCPPGGLLACDDDTCGLQTEVGFSALAGQSYRIRVGGFGFESGSGTLTVSSNDVQAPALSCPADVSVDAAPGTCDAFVALPAASATDNCDAGGELVTNGGFESSSFDGWVATDTLGGGLGPWEIDGFGFYGNGFPYEGSHWATNGFDGCGPGSYDLTQVVTLPPGSVTLHWSDRIQWDLFSFGASLPRAFEVLVDGAVVHRFEVEAGTLGDTGWVAHTVDLSGFAGATVTLHFREDIPECFTGPGQVDIDAISIVGGGLGGLTNSFNGTGDASGTYGLGATAVTWSAVDSSGNLGECSHTVTVADAEPPTVVCPADLTVAADPGVCQAFVAPAAPTAADNCGVASLLNDVNGTGDASDFYPVGTTTVTWTVTDLGGALAQCTQTITVSDLEPPALSCAPDLSVHADAGGCDADLVVTAPSAVTDNCAVASIVNDRTGTSDASGVYASGTTALAWTATDASGNQTSCSQEVDVSFFNELLADLELAPSVASSVDRCLRFELFDCSSEPVAVDATVSFVDGFATAASVLVPCGGYACASVQDQLHTLTVVDPTFGVVDRQFRLDATGDPVTGGRWLTGGNLNGDTYVDILDFGVLAGEWGVDYGTGDTTCSTAFPHADTGGDGLVFTDDFTFIQIAFLMSQPPGCCGAPLRDPGDGPRTSIPVEELGLHGLEHLAVADLDGNGVLDGQDIAAWMEGARPRP